jgi:hypothetical protein
MRRLHAHFRYVTGAALVVFGCRVGGSTEDPYAEPLPSDAATSAGGSSGATTSTAGASDTGGTTDGLRVPSETASGGEPSNGAAGGSASGGGPSSGAAGGGASSCSSGGCSGGPPRQMPISGGGSSETGSPIGGCQPVQAPVICDPVHNVGCLVPFTACDIDPTQAVFAGRCVFPWTTVASGGAAGACYVDATTNTCLASSTCVDGSCRKLCYCDSQCSPGQCCTDPAPGSAIVKLCKSC